MHVALHTDLYELTMAASYLRRSMTQRATFSLFVRRLPAGRGFLVAAGLDDVLRRLEDYRFAENDLEWLATQGFSATDIEAFRDLRFTGDVWAIAEGHVVFADEPLLEVTAPLPEAQLVETLMLNQITYQTALSTKAARCRLAAGGRAALADFSLRRTHGLEAGMAVARAAAIAGFVGTSNVAAALRLGFPAVGTMAHSYVEAFPDERGAFLSFADDFPERATFLVDTYDTLNGVATAIEVAGARGLTRFGVRLDSGDVATLSRQTRAMLDAAGYHDATIVVSGGLDEHDVGRLLDEGAPIDVFGIGTSLGVSTDAPTLDSAYKLVEYDGRPVMKLSTGKENRPGPKQVFRSSLQQTDQLATRTEPAPEATTPLLIPVMSNGRRLREPESIEAMRTRLAADLDALPDPLRALDAAPPRPVLISADLAKLSERVRAELHPSGNRPDT
jgi:nicotinate phosphoribosyltransferase